MLVDIDNNPIKVSVIIAVYNSELYLEQALTSICDQSLMDIEIILVDDGSSDRSMEIMRSYVERDDRIRVLIQNEESDGAALARNMGISAAKGEYLSILDADDFFEPDMLEKAYRTAKNANADVVIFDGWVYDDQLKTDKITGMILQKENIPAGERVFKPDDNKDNLFEMTIGSAWNALFQRDFIRRNDIRFHSFHHADDIGFVYVAYALSERIAVMNERLIHYRMGNPFSQAATLAKWPDACCRALLSLKNCLEKEKVFDLYKKTYSRKALKYIDFYLSAIDDYESYITLFKEVKDKYLDELGLMNAQEKLLGSEKLILLRDIFRDSDASELLFREKKAQAPFDTGLKWTQEVEPGARIILYGAGKLGRRILANILKGNVFRLAAWADAKYESIGYPVVSPDKLINVVHDHIIIAVESFDVYKNIEEDLISKGLSPQKIMWACQDQG